MYVARLIVIASLPLLLIVAACTSEDRSLILMVSWEEPAPSIAETIQQRFATEDLSIVVDVPKDPAAIFESIQNGEADLGVVEEPDHAIPGVVTIAPLYPSVLHVLHNFESEPTDFVELLRDANIYAGPIGGAAHRLLLQLAADFGVGSGEFQVLDNPWTLNPDVYFEFGGLLSDDSIRQLSDYRLFSFASRNDAQGGSVADAIVLKHHHLKSFMLPKSTYYTLNDEAVVTLSIRTVMIAHEDFPADLALEIASLLFNNAQEFSMNYPLVTQELNFGLDPVELMFPLHSGSRRFLNRDQPGFIERYVDIIALFLTIVFALASGLFALYRRQQQIKKDRVDDFYAKLLDVRDDAEKTPDRQGLKICRVKALAVQQEVLRLLIEERVSADASLIAFLSLSNQIINELNHRIDHDI